MLSRIPRVRRWEYVNCFLESVRESDNVEQTEARLIKTKIDFERKKSLALGRGKIGKKGLRTAKQLVRDTRLMAIHLGLIEGAESLKLSRAGEILLNNKVVSKQFLDVVLPRLFLSYRAIGELFNTLLTVEDNEIMLPQQRDITNFRMFAKNQKMPLGQTDFMVSRDLLSQLGLVNWFSFENQSERFCRTYLASIVQETSDLTNGKDNTYVEWRSKKMAIKRRRMLLKDFVDVLWDNYLCLAKGIPLKPVFYSALRDAVCYQTRTCDIEFDDKMSILLAKQDFGGYSLFGSGGTIPYSHLRSAGLKYLPLKFSNGRYIIYIKMEEI